MNLDNSRQLCKPNGVCSTIVTTCMSLFTYCLVNLLLMKDLGLKRSVLTVSTMLKNALFNKELQALITMLSAQKQCRAGNHTIYYSWCH